MKRSYDDMDVLVIEWPASNPATLSLVLEELKRNPRKFSKIHVLEFPRNSNSPPSRILCKEILKLAEVHVLEAPTLQTLDKMCEVYHDDIFGDGEYETSVRLQIGKVADYYSFSNPLDYSYLRAKPVKEIYLPNFMRNTFDERRYRAVFSEIHQNEEWSDDGDSDCDLSPERHICFIKGLSWWFRTRHGLPGELIFRIFQLVGWEGTLNMERTARIEWF